MSNLRKAFHLMNVMKSQWWSYKDLQQLQDKKLRAMIKYVYDTLPMYHEKLRQAKILPDDIKTSKDLLKLPYLTKEEIQKNFPQGIVSPTVDINQCWTPHTSGSTGKSMTMVYDVHAEDFEKAIALRPNLSCGQKLFDKWAVVTCPDHINQKKWFQKFGLFSQQQISLFENINDQIRKLELINPDVLDGYASSLYLIAKEIQSTPNTKIKPKIVFSTSEMLTTNMRNVIDSAFNVNMFDQFGCVEIGRTAWECPAHSGYHMDMEAVIMEFIKDDEQVTSGEPGEIIYTNLYNYAMPLIRYRVGDIGVPTDEKCSCGRGLPLMKLLEGRKDDFMKLPNGRILSPISWIVILMHYEFEQYKVTQETINKIVIQIVPGKNFSQEDVVKIKNESKNVLGNDVEIEIKLVDMIPREKSGKMKPIISKVKSDW
jgi:phenylacetate-CoA ligase